MVKAVWKTFCIDPTPLNVVLKYFHCSNCNDLYIYIISREMTIVLKHIFTIHTYHTCNIIPEYYVSQRFSLQS